MPEVLEILKRSKELKKEIVAKHMRAWITEHSLDDRDRSIAWALNRLEKEGYVAHPRTGIWRITEKGLAATLTLDEARLIVERWVERERLARRSQTGKQRG
jgi:repressor of nif and glnA expression